MKRFLFRVLHEIGKLGSLFVSKTTITRRAVLRTEERERKEVEDERLDRLRNPSNYRGR